MPARVVPKPPSRSSGGVDPGREGFLVLVRDGRPVRANPIPYLDTEIDRLALMGVFRGWIEEGCELVYLEHQQAFGRENPNSIWTAAEAYGVLKGCLDWAGLPFQTIKPDKWKPRIGIPVEKGGKLPKFPRPLARGASAEAVEAWETEVSEIKRRRKGLRKDRQGRLKEIAVSRAQALAPGYDFRPSERAKVPSNGKAEAFLLAVLAGRDLGGG